MKRKNTSVSKIADMRSKDMSYKEIADELGISVSEVGRKVAAGKRKDADEFDWSSVPVEAVDIDPESLPLMTLSGIMHTVPVSPPRLSQQQRADGVQTCNVCLWLDKCHEWVTQGDFVACERPLRSELIGYDGDRQDSMAGGTVLANRGARPANESDRLFEGSGEAGGPTEADIVRHVRSPGDGLGEWGVASRRDVRDRGLIGLDIGAREAPQAQPEWRQLRWEI